MFAAKSEFIRANQLVVWRFSDHWRLRSPDPFAAGLADALGWARYAADGDPGRLMVPAVTLDALAARVKSRLEARGGVSIREGSRRARCDEARYDRSAQQIVCRGNPAELFDADDRLAGVDRFGRARRQRRCLAGRRGAPGQERGGQDQGSDGNHDRGCRIARRRAQSGGQVRGPRVARVSTGPYVAACPILGSARP